MEGYVGVTEGLYRWSIGLLVLGFRVGSTTT